MPDPDADAGWRKASGLYSAQYLEKLLAEACNGWWSSSEWAQGDFSPELLAWWQAHMEADRRRMAEEQAKAQRQAMYEAALAKLTPEERAVLGLPPTPASA